MRIKISGITNYHKRGAYSKQEHPIQEFIDLSNMMDTYHNTTIFQPGHICEQVFMPNEVLAPIIEEMNSYDIENETLYLNDEPVSTPQFGFSSRLCFAGGRRYLGGINNKG